MPLVIGGAKNWPNHWPETNHGRIESLKSLKKLVGPGGLMSEPWHQKKPVKSGDFDID